LGVDADTLPRPLEGTPQVILLLKQPLVPCAFLVVHFGAGASQPLGVVLLRNCSSERRRPTASDPTFC
jgi:hypothetical protein